MGLNLKVFKSLNGDPGEGIKEWCVVGDLKKV